MVRIQAFQACCPGSNPGGCTILLQPLSAFAHRVGVEHKSKKTGSGYTYQYSREGYHLFVKKNKLDPGAKEFYYLGKMKFEEFISDGTPCEIRYRLLKEVRSDIYDYIV